MSYRYRKNKRILAHEIIGMLYFDATKDIKNEFAEPSFLNYHEIIARKTKDQGYTSGVLKLLLDKQHITRYGHAGDKTLIRITADGMDAFRSGHYKMENRKDILESVEVNTKWFIPLLSLALSVAALIVSILKK